jgi:hypothetical protein
MSDGVWVRSVVEVNEGETLYFFHPADGGGGKAWVALGRDGTVEFSGDRKVTIQNAGDNDESVTVTIDGAIEV